MPRWLKLFLIIALLGAMAALTMPWWFGGVARPILGRWNITLVNCRADGLLAMRADEVRFARGNTTVVARDLQMPTPLAWVRPSARRASAGTWSVVVKPSATSATTPGAIDGMPALQTRLQKIAVTLQRWLTHATVGAGEVRWPRGQLALAGATWQNRVLAGRDVVFLGQTFDLTVDASPAESLIVEARQPSQETRARLEWRKENITGAGTWWGQPMNLQATFPAAGWLPDTAEARAENWTLPAERARLGAQYVQLTGAGVLTWRQGNFTASLRAHAEPQPGMKAPPFEARLEAKGDTQAVTVSLLQVDAPFARASLSAPVTFAWGGQTSGVAAQLAVEMDLAKQPWVEATGRLTGSVSVTSGTRQEFSLAAEGVVFRGFTAQRAIARGHWDWPRLVFSELEVHLDDASQARLTGTLDWQNRQLENVTLDATAAASSLTRWLPAGITWKEALLKATLSGPLATPHHEGALQVSGAQAGPLKPFDLAATWRGDGATAEDFSANLTAEKSRLHAAGRADAAGLSLRELVFAPAGVEQLVLVEPARVEWSPALRVPGVRLQGPTGSLAWEATPGVDGSFRVSAARFDKEWLHDWLDLRGPTWRVSQLEVSGRVVDRVLHFKTSLLGEIHLPGREIAQILLTASGDQTGVNLNELKISESGRIVTQASGRIAASWTMDPAPQLRMNRDAPLELKANVLPESPLWAALGEPAGVTFGGAAAQTTLQGTLALPQGELRVTIDSLKVAADSRWHDALPDVAALTLAASGDRTQVRIDSFQAKIESQEVRGSALLPMAANRWQQLLTEPAKFNWREAEARIDIPGADLGALARRFPKFVAARGQLQAEIALARGGDFTGSVRLTGAATRPLPALGVVQEINTTVRFSGRSGRIESFTGLLGGEPLHLEGQVEFPRTGEPRFDVYLSGKNLPLVRQAGLLVRSDLDLNAKSEGERTRLSGLVTLRDCLVLSDFSDLLPTGVRGTRRLPPYFSVTAEPFNRWLLAIELRGASAVRVRTPFFTGTASAHFTLSGNLGEPRAIGEITVEEGRMFFPFATFNVENGAIRLRAADPFHPELALNAVSRRHNYELRLEATGTPEAPVVVFSSNPAMEAGQVLLMVMAGQVPANETAGNPGQGGLRLTQLGAYLGQGIYRGLGGTGENRLEIVSGERVSRQGRETYEVEYKLGERWALVGEYDEFDSYNGGVKWRVYSKGGSGDKK